MLSLTLALLASGAHAQVTLETLMETPILRHEPLVTASGADIAALGTGMTLDETGEVPVVVWGVEDASLTVTGEMQPGNWKVRVKCVAPSRGSDSFWVHLDGEQQTRALTTPVDELRWAEHGFRIAEPGEHEVKLTLREAPGLRVSDFEVVRLSVSTDEPPIREELVPKHPRLHLTAEMLEDLPALVEARKDWYVPSGPPSEKLHDYDAAKGNCGWARSLSRYALAYRISPDEEYLRLLKAQVMNIVEFSHWGNPKWGRMWDTDLDAEYAMEGVALCYDWLYDEWTDGERAKIRDRIALQCERIFTASLAGRTGGGYDYQQNHFWFPHYALMLGAAAVYEDVPEAREWLAWSYDRIERILVTFAHDGGFHEHASYWDFSVPPLFQAIDLQEYLTGERIDIGEGWLRKTAAYRFHNVFPGLKGSAALGDCKKSVGPGFLPNYMWLAQRYNDPVVWGMVDALHTAPSSSPWFFLFSEPAAPRKDPFGELPTAAYYDDIETVFARTDWTPEATMLAFICRPMGGKHWWDIAHRYGLNAVGHNHPDANHFILFGRGEVLCVDPGYTYTKLTRNHNTVLVDGKGQYGDGEMWPRMNDGWGEIEEFRAEGGSVYIRGNATKQYKPELGLTRFVREIELLDRDHVVIRDELAAKEPTTFTWLLHHEGDIAEVGPNTYEMTKGAAKLGIQVFCDQELAFRLEEIEPNYEHTQRSVRPDDAPVLGELAVDIGPTTAATVTVALTMGDTDAELARARLAGAEPPWVEW